MNLWQASKGFHQPQSDFQPEPVLQHDTDDQLEQDFDTESCVEDFESEDQLEQDLEEKRGHKAKVWLCEKCDNKLANNKIQH